jgi:hypothetical protein
MAMNCGSLSVRRPFPAAIPRGFQVAITGLAIVLCFRKSNLAFLWLALPLVLPAFRGLFFSSAREHLRLAFRRLWADLESFSQGHVRCPWRATFTFVIGPAFLFLLSNQCTLTNGDTWPVLPTAAQLVTAGNARLDDDLSKAPAVYGRPLPYSALRTEAGVYSRYPAGMVMFAAPVAALARLCGAHIDRPALQQRLEKWTAAAVTAVALGQFFLIALHIAPPGPALIATGLLATGSALTSTCGQALWQQGGVIFWMLVAILAEFRRTARPFATTPLVQGIACALMLACRLSAALFVGAFGVWLLCRAPRRALLTGVIALAAYLPWAAAYVAVYGNVSGPSTEQLAGSWWSWDPLTGLSGLLFSPSRGLLVYQPWVILLPGIWLLRRRAGNMGPLLESQKQGPGATRSPAGWRMFCWTIVVLHLGLVANWRIWWGGHCWGSRLLAEIVPLLALLSVPVITAMAARRVGRLALLGLAIVSFLPHAPVLYGRALEWNRRTDQHPALYWSWSEAPFLEALAH